MTGKSFYHDFPPANQILDESSLETGLLRRAFYVLAIPQITQRMADYLFQLKAAGGIDPRGLCDVVTGPLVGASRSSLGEYL